MAAKKVLFVISSLCKGGSERVLSILANGFVNKGYKVSIITFTSPEVAYPLHPEIRVISLYKAFRSFHIGNRLKWFFTVLAGIYKWSAAEEYDAIISFGQNTNIKVLLANFFLKNKIIVSDRFDPRFFSTSSEIFVRNKVYPLAKHIVVQTQEIKSEQYNHFKKVKVIYNPLMEHNKVAALKSKTIVTVGRLDAAKNHQFLIRHLKDILPPGWQFCIIGDGEDRTALQGLIDKYGMRAQIKLLGKVDDVYDRIAEASLFVYASASEGYPNAVIEAMSVGLPVVSSNCKYGPNEIIRDGVNGFLFNLNEPESFKEKVLALINNESLRRQIGSAAIKIKEQTNEPAIMNQWLDLMY